MYKVAISRCVNYNIDEVNYAITELMQQLGYNFIDFIKPGMTVFIKPNWVASRWRESAPHIDTLWSVITHTAIIQAVADRVAKALCGKGKIIIGDNPSIDADFEELMQFTNIRKLVSKYDVPCEIIDLRPLVCKDLKDYGKKNKMHSQSGDPYGKVEINLGKESLFYNIDSKMFRGVFDEREDTIASHTGDAQLYSFSKSLYNSDVYISIPKLKTHHKAGITVNLKGLVGCISDKNQLVHWRLGTPDTGGDEYPNQESYQAGMKAKIKNRGAHPGNDSIWRMVVDLYNAMHKRNRKYFSIVDGIIAGEGEGPFCPRSKIANVLIAGDNLLTVDIVSARIMGIDPYKIRYIKHFFDTKAISFNDINVLSKEYDQECFFTSISSYLDFNVPEQWQDIKY